MTTFEPFFYHWVCGFDLNGNIQLDNECQQMSKGSCTITHVLQILVSRINQGTTSLKLCRGGGSLAKTVSC